MRMSEFAGTETFKIYVKFLKSEHLEDFLIGKLFMNNIKYFIELEKKHKIKGMGDRREAGFVIRPDKMYIQDPETNKVLIRSVKAEIIRRHERSPEVPVFCFTEFTAKDFVFIEENKNEVKFKLDIGNDANRLMEFGDKAVIFGPSFREKILKASEEQKITVKMKGIEYHSFDEIDKEKEALFEKGSTEMFFWKDEYFSYQREARLILPYTFVEEKFIFDIGSLEDSTVLSIRDFFQKSTIIARKEK